MKNQKIVITGLTFVCMTSLAWMPRDDDDLITHCWQLKNSNSCEQCGPTPAQPGTCSIDGECKHQPVNPSFVYGVEPAENGRVQFKSVHPPFAPSRNPCKLKLMVCADGHCVPTTLEWTSGDVFDTIPSGPACGTGTIDPPEIQW